MYEFEDKFQQKYMTMYLINDENIVRMCPKNDPILLSYIYIYMGIDSYTFALYLSFLLDQYIL